MTWPPATKLFWFIHICWYYMLLFATSLNEEFTHSRGANLSIITQTKVRDLSKLRNLYAPTHINPGPPCYCHTPCSRFIWKYTLSKYGIENWLVFTLLTWIENLATIISYLYVVPQPPSFSSSSSSCPCYLVIFICLWF